MVEGIRFDKEKYVWDETYNAPTDIIELVEPQLYENSINGQTYWFGYKFTKDSSSKDRTRFIRDLKQIGEEPLTDDQVRQFIERPLSALDRKVNLYEIGAFLYPISQLNTLVKKIIAAVNAYSSHDMVRMNFELVKSLPANVKFDFDAFEASNIVGTKSGDQSLRDSLKYIENTLLPKLRSSDYISIARDVPQKYKLFISNFLEFSSENEKGKFEKLTETDSILIVDDVSTTHSTLNEILRIVNAVNSKCKIYIYTLIGK